MCSVQTAKHTKSLASETIKSVTAPDKATPPDKTNLSQTGTCNRPQPTMTKKHKGGQMEGLQPPSTDHARVIRPRSSPTPSNDISHRCVCSVPTSHAPTPPTPKRAWLLQAQRGQLRNTSTGTEKLWDSFDWQRPTADTQRPRRQLSKPEKREKAEREMCPLFEPTLLKRETLHTLCAISRSPIAVASLDFS